MLNRLSVSTSSRRCGILTAAAVEQGLQRGPLSLCENAGNLAPLARTPTKSEWWRQPVASTGVGDQPGRSLPPRLPESRWEQPKPAPYRASRPAALSRRLWTGRLAS